MAISNGKHSATTFRDISAIMIDPFGDRIDLGNVVMIEKPKPNYDTIDRTFLTGVNLYASLEKNWSGSFEVVRKNARLEQMFARMDKQWKTEGTKTFGSITFFTTEADGSQTEETYSGVDFRLEDAGNYSDKEVTQKVSYTAQFKD